MCIELTGQMSFVECPDLWYGRTSQELSAAENQRERTSESSWKLLSASQGIPLLCLSLQKESGRKPESSSATDTVSHGDSTTHASGAFRKEEGESLWSWILTAIPLPISFLSDYHVGEAPIDPIPTHLREVLEYDPDPKYDLSARAAEGIIRRATDRGKTLPEMLETALKQTVAKG